MRFDPLYMAYSQTTTGASSSLKNDSGAKFFTIQVKGRAAGATSWTVNLEGSNNGTNWSTIVSHGTVDTDGVIKNSGATPWPAAFLRLHVSSVTMGSAGYLDIYVNGVV